MIKKENKEIIKKTIILFLLIVAVSIFVSDFQKFKIPNNKASEICSELDSSKKYYCLAVVNKNGDFCEKLTGNEKKLCLAMAKENFDYCKKIEDKESREICYYKFILSKNQPNYCEETKNKEDCYFYYISHSYLRSNFEDLKIEYCDKVKESKKQTCLALQKQDRDLCNNRLFCLSFFKNELYLCKGITGEDKFKCYRDRALTSKDVSICEEIINPYWKDVCYSEYASHINSKTSICDEISDKNLRELCYIEVALRFSE